jgi:hypothetical protein
MVNYLVGLTVGHAFLIYLGVMILTPTFFIAAGLKTL